MRAARLAPLVLLAAACGGDPAPTSPLDAAPAPDADDGTRRVGVFGPPNNKLDILFVIDNSGSMEEEQASLSANFPAFINTLQSLEGGLPDLHIGVVSSNMGTAPFSIMNCEVSDEGALQNTPRVKGCTPPDGRYIIDSPSPDGTRTRNYEGTLAETFACIAELGTDGCAFEQHLASMKAALDGSNSLNAGFLRADAALGVVFLADEDDCSVTDGAMFDDSQTTTEDPLGPLTSFRCFEFGVECDEDVDPQAAGPRTNCRARTDSPYMPHTDEYVAFLHSLKADPLDIVVAGLIGNTEPVVVGTDPERPENPSLEPSCQSGSGKAQPSVRFDTFLDAFEARHVFSTICNENLTDGIVGVASLATTLAGVQCLNGELPSSDPTALEARCTVADVIALDQPGEQRAEIPACSGPSSTLPCYRFEIDESCPLNDAGIVLDVERGDTPVPADSVVVVECL